MIHILQLQWSFFLVLGEWWIISTTLMSYKSKFWLQTSIFSIHFILKLLKSKIIFKIRNYIPSSFNNYINNRTWFKTLKHVMLITSQILTVVLVIAFLLWDPTLNPSLSFFFSSFFSFSVTIFYIHFNCLLLSHLPR